MKRPLPLHPFLFTLYPLFYIYATNLGQMTFSQMVRSLLLFPALTGLALLLVWLLLRVVLKQRAALQRAALWVSLGVLAFFSFGHLQNWLDSGLRRAGGILGLAVLGLAWGITRLRSMREPTVALKTVSAALKTVSAALNAASAALLGWSLVSVGLGEMNTRALLEEADPMRREVSYLRQPRADRLPQPSAVLPDPMPDIYYIILDGYGQQQMLADLYGLDNEPFIEALRARGFVVAADSHANYPQTLLSLASSLNLNYLQDLALLNLNLYSRAPMMDLMQDSLAQRFLRGLGYRTVALETGYEYTDLRSADTFLRAGFYLNLYEQTLLATTLLKPWYDPLQLESQRRQIVANFWRAGEAAGLPGPKFVFAHLLLPHPPFMFDRTGAPTGLMKYKLNDGSHYELGRASYVHGYSEQLLYANTLALELIDAILAQSETPPVIILQGDHGPGAYLDWNSLGGTCLRERLSILNAYYLPPQVAEGVYPSITPVNSLRVVFDGVFGTDLGLLPDRSYFAIWDRPYDWFDVTGQVESCAPLGR